jgi:hypothetical protein
MTRMNAMLVDRSVTRVHLVALPEEMPVNEAVELHRALADTSLPLGTMFLNGFWPSRFSPDEIASLAASKGPELAASRIAASSWAERQELSRFYASRLAAEVPLPLVTLPQLFAPSFNRACIEALSPLVRSGASDD